VHASPHVTVKQLKIQAFGLTQHAFILFFGAFLCPDVFPSMDNAHLYPWSQQIEVHVVELRNLLPPEIDYS